MTERLGLMVEEAQTFTENTIFMTERLGLMVEEAQTFTENTIFMTECFLYH
jgi:pantoate kinase